MANRFLDQRKVSQPTEAPTAGEPTQNRFLSQIEGKPLKKSEKFTTAAGRTIAQPFLGAAKRFTWPLDLLQLLGTGESLEALNELDPARIAELKEKFPQAPWENFKGVDPEKFKQAIEEASASFPTQANIERAIEQETGLPLEAKTPVQKALRLGSTAASFKPGAISQKAVAGVTAPAVSKVATGLGVPESIAEPIALIAAGAAPTPTIEKQLKPSGMPVRRYENLKKEIKVTPARQNAIKESVEKDFKKQADKLFTEESRTYSAMKEDSRFKEKISDVFEEVEKLAEQIEQPIHTENLRTAFKDRIRSREQKGITPDEFEKSLRRESRKIAKDFPYRDASALEFVQQFRKNNQSLGKLFEPTKSSAQNLAKKEALLEYNRAIEDVFQKNFPKSEFAKTFKFGNKRWSEILDVERIDKFIDDTFSGKIDYKNIKSFFKKNSKDRQAIERLIGKDRFKDFEVLAEDLLSTEKAMSLIKKAEDQGFTKAASTAAAYLIHPKAGAVKFLGGLGKQAYQTLLDKPQYIVLWKNSLKQFKEGKFEQALAGFEKLNKELTQANRTNPTGQPKRKE